MLITGIFIGAIVLTTLLIVGLKSNAAMVFLALCGGSVLVTLMGEDVRLVASSMSSGNQVAVIAAEIGLLVAPAILCVIFLKGSVSKPKMLFQLLPALATGLVGILLVVPLLSNAAQQAVADNFLWQQINEYQPVILLVGVFGSLMVAAVTHHGSKHGKHDDHKKKHHKF